jgi:hypothetical protein
MAEDTRLAFLVGLDVADGSRRPAWYPGDEFETARKQTLEGGGGAGR